MSRRFQFDQPVPHAPGAVPGPSEPPVPHAPGAVPGPSEPIRATLKSGRVLDAWYETTIDRFYEYGTSGFTFSLDEIESWERITHAEIRPSHPPRNYITSMYNAGYTVASNSNVIFITAS